MGKGKTPVVIICSQDSDLVSLFLRKLSKRFYIDIRVCSSALELEVLVKRLGARISLIFYETGDLGALPFEAPSGTPFVFISESLNINYDFIKTISLESLFNFVRLKSMFLEDLEDFIPSLFLRLNFEEVEIENVRVDGESLRPVHIDCLKGNSTAQSDLYLKINDNKFIKILNLNDNIEHSLFEKLKEKECSFLYQKAIDFNNILNKNLVNLSNRLKNEDLTKAERVASEVKSIQEVHHAVKLLGITPEVLSVVNGVVDSLLENLKSNKGLFSLVRNLLRVKSPLYSRTAICNYILGTICNKESWISYQSFKKLIHASIFCDLSFDSDHEKLCFVLDPLESNSGFENRDLELIFKHPEASCKLMESKDAFLTDEVHIILHHHEKPDGSGFPRGLNHNSTPVLTCLFILSYNLANHLVCESRMGRTADIESIFSEFDEIYKKGNYENPYMSLRKAFGRHWS